MSWIIFTKSCKGFRLSYFLKKNNVLEEKKHVFFDNLLED